jgi:hypothetical protein
VVGPYLLVTSVFGDRLKFKPDMKNSRIARWFKSKK